jgi:hypothetical protein
MEELTGAVADLLWLVKLQFFYDTGVEYTKNGDADPND